MSKVGRGQICTYCRRVLESKTSIGKLAATRDHTIPKVDGGRHTVWCCRQCNTIKGSMHPEDWEAFMELNPEWWKLPKYENVGRSRVFEFQRWQQQTRVQPAEVTTARVVTVERGLTFYDGAPCVPRCG